MVSRGDGEAVDALWYVGGGKLSGGLPGQVSSFGGVDMYVDLGAERILAAQRENGKIAVERYRVRLVIHDGTEGGIANELVDSGTDTRSESVPERCANRGVPKHDIVLGFHSPFKRQFTEFAVG